VVDTVLLQRRRTHGKCPTIFAVYSILDKFKFLTIHLKHTFAAWLHQNDESFKSNNEKSCFYSDFCCIAWNNFQTPIIFGFFSAVTSVFKTTQPPQTKFTVCCLQWTTVNQTEILLGIRLISIQPLLKLSFVITDWLKLIRKTISLNKALKIQRFYLIDGCPLQIACRKFWLCGLHSFENAGNHWMSGRQRKPKHSWALKIVPLDTTKIVVTCKLCSSFLGGGVRGGGKSTQSPSHDLPLKHSIDHWNYNGITLCRSYVGSYY